MVGSLDDLGKSRYLQDDCGEPKGLINAVRAEICASTKKPSFSNASSSITNLERHTTRRHQLRDLDMQEQFIARTEELSTVIVKASSIPPHVKSAHYRGLDPVH